MVQLGELSWGKINEPFHSIYLGQVTTASLSLSLSLTYTHTLK